MAAAFQKAKLGRGDLIMVLDFSSYEGQVILLAGHLIKAVIAAVYNNFKISYYYTYYSSSLKKISIDIIKYYLNIMF